MDDEKDVKAILDRKFKPEDIGKDNGGFSYVKPHLVIGRLNEAVGPTGWSFELLEYRADEKWITQYGRLGIRDEKGEWVWKENCGGKRRTYLRDKPKTPENLLNPVNDDKSAASNCFKRCAMMFGVALHLYGDTEQSDEDAPGTPPSKSSEQKGGGAAGGGEGAGSGGEYQKAGEAMLAREKAVMIASGLSQPKLRVKLMGEGNTEIVGIEKVKFYHALLDDETTWKEADEGGELPKGLRDKDRGEYP